MQPAINKLVSPVQGLLVLQCRARGWSDVAHRVEVLAPEAAVAGWEGPGTLAVAPGTWDDALEAVTRAPESWPEPTVGPCPDGSMHVSWWLAEPGQKVLIETRDGRFVWTVSNKENKPEARMGEATSPGQLWEELRRGLTPREPTAAR